jgi:cytochrome c-type biogenesis protein CcmH
MGLFTAVAGALALLTALILARPLLGGRGDTDARGVSDARLYRDQLAEIGRDLERGTISAAEAEAAKAEVSRRLLAATHRAETAAPLSPAPRSGAALAAGLALVGAPLLALAIYLGQGSPGLPDMPFADRRPAVAQRPTQEQAEAMVPPRDAAPVDAGEQDYAGLITRLEAILAQRPDDIEGHRLLAYGYMRLGRYAQAWRAYDKLIRLLGPEAEPRLFITQLDAMVQAAGGYLSPEAETLLARVRHQSPADPGGRYYSGLLMAQQGDVAGAIAAWEVLRAELPSGAPMTEFLDGMLARARTALAGDGGPGPGPSTAEIEAAADLSPEERQAMIAGMVARLETRLTSEGGAVEEWLKLINAYVQLGRPEDARRIYDLGAADLGTGAEADFLREQALTLGVIPE